MTAEVLKRVVHVGSIRMRVVMEIDIPLKKDWRKVFNMRVVSMSRDFVRIGEDIVLLTTEEMERKP